VPVIDLSTIRQRKAVFKLSGNNDASNKKLEFYFGDFGRFIPMIIAVIFILIAAVNQVNVQGYVIAFFAALVFGVLFVKNPKEYCEAAISGLGRPIFAIISIAVLLSAVAGALVSRSGLIHTLAAAVIGADFTGGMFAAFAFVVCCVLSMATGTSVGTYIVSFPIFYPIGVMVGVHPSFMAGALASGALFGDNLAPISDTTIASAGSQKCDMGACVRTRCWYSLPAAAAVFFIQLFFGGRGGTISPEIMGDLTVTPLSYVMLIVPVVIITLCLMRTHLIAALSYGIVVGIVAGIGSGLYPVSAIFNYPGGFRVGGMFVESIIGAAGTVMMLYGVFALLGVMDKSGVIDVAGAKITSLAKGVRGTEATIALSIGFMAWITGVIAVGMVALGDVVAEIGEKVGLNKYRRANLMDCGAIGMAALVPWTVHSVLPAQLASTALPAAALSPVQVLTHNFYAIVLLVIVAFAIITGYARNHDPDREVGNNAAK